MDKNDYISLLNSFITSSNYSTYYKILYTFVKSKGRQDAESLTNLLLSIPGVREFCLENAIEDICRNHHIYTLYKNSKPILYY